MTSMSRTFKNKVYSAPPKQRIEVVLALRKPLRETRLRGQLQNLGGRLISSSPDSDYIVVDMAAENILHLETLSDDITRVMEDSPVDLIP